MTNDQELRNLPQPWRTRGLRFALHLGVAALDKPLFKHSAGSLDPLDHIELAADLGFAGISDNMLKRRSEAVQSRMGDALAKQGLAMGSFTNTPPGAGESGWGNPDPAVGQAFFNSVDLSIEAGKRTGGRIINVIAMAASGVDRDVQLRVFGERVLRMADRVAREGMILALEPTSVTRMPAALVHHIAEVRAILDTAHHPALQLLFDTGHVHEMEGDPLAAYASSKDLAADTVQLANTRDRLEPGSGDTDFVAFLRYLISDGFGGLLELEHYLKEDTQAAEVHALRRLGEIVDQL